MAAVRDSIRLGHISGIPVGLHWSLMVFAAIGMWNLADGLLPLIAPESGTPATLLAALIGVVGLFASIVAHELAHAVVARRCGVEVDGITLWMLGGVARLRSEPTSAAAAGAIAAAGPAVSVVSGLVLAAMAWGGSVAGTGPLITGLVTYLAAINIVLAVFNLVPALPLDGGRIYQAWLWHRTGDPDRSTVRAAGVGRGLGALLAGVGVAQALFADLAGLWLVLLGAFVISLASAERRRAQARLQAARFQRLWSGPTGVGPVVAVASCPAPNDEVRRVDQR